MDEALLAEDLASDLVYNLEIWLHFEERNILDLFVNEVHVIHYTALEVNKSFPSSAPSLCFYAVLRQ